jgi:hypothetical protein
MKENDKMKIKVGGARPHPQNGVLSHRGGAKPEATTSGGFHGGTMHVKGRVHEAPTKPMINAANYGAQKVRRK